MAHRPTRKQKGLANYRDDASGINIIYPLKEAAEKFAAAEKAKQMELTADPVRLEVLHRSAAQLEEAIEKRVRRLRNR